MSSNHHHANTSNAWTHHIRCQSAQCILSEVSSMLQDDLLVVDESQLLVPPPPSAPHARPPSPAAPPGVLSVQQLQQLAEALAQAAPAGFLAAADAVELMLRMASQGEAMSALLEGLVAALSREYTISYFPG
jgi:hypothetical protein